MCCIILWTVILVAMVDLSPTLELQVATSMFCVLVYLYYSII